MITYLKVICSKNLNINNYHSYIFYRNTFIEDKNYHLIFGNYLQFRCFILFLIQKLRLKNQMKENNATFF